MVRLRDLGGGEPNDDLTWTLFEDGSRLLPPSRRDEPVEAPSTDDVEGGVGDDLAEAPPTDAERAGPSPEGAA